MRRPLIGVAVTIGLVLPLSSAMGQTGENMKQEAKPAETAKPAADAAKPADAAPRPRIALELESAGQGFGKIVLELDDEKAPITVDNFLQYVADGFYNGTIFHRVIPTFMIQAGGFTPEVVEKKNGLRPGIKNEWKNGLKNVKGTISMARVGGQPDSASAQFFINVKDNAQLDRPQPDGAAYAVFGKVVEGADVVDKVKDAKCIQHPNYGGQGAVTPEAAIIIKTAALLPGYDRTKLTERVKAMLAVEIEARNVMGESLKQSPEELAKRFEADKSKATKNPSGLMWVTQKEGTGPQPGPTDRVEVHYSGWLLNGRKFDSSVERGSPYAFSLKGGVIQGWLEGVATMKVGERRTLIIPAELGYGARGSGDRIPPNSTLVFDITLLGIK